LDQRPVLASLELVDDVLHARCWISVGFRLQPARLSTFNEDNGDNHIPFLFIAKNAQRGSSVPGTGTLEPGSRGQSRSAWLALDREPVVFFARRRD
jgi:hypothetical protein